MIRLISIGSVKICYFLNNRPHRPVSRHSLPMKCVLNSFFECKKYKINKKMYHKNPPVVIRSKSMRFDTRGSLTAIEDLVQCAICFDRLQNPKMLACQHTFCHGCLEAIFSNSIKGTRECPTCRMAFTAQLSDLPTNLYICSLLKLVGSATDSLSSSPTTCHLVRYSK